MHYFKYFDFYFLDERDVYGKKENRNFPELSYSLIVIKKNGNISCSGTVAVWHINCISHSFVKFRNETSHR
jgi:hypothetical protein